MVIAIIPILAAPLIPTLPRTREALDASEAVENLTHEDLIDACMVRDIDA